MTVKHKVVRVGETTYQYRGFDIFLNPTAPSNSQKWSCRINGIVIHRIARKRIVKWIDAVLDLK